ncbi:hypothetical protein IPM65_00585 [Candidatus Roizmanbacteria bacterium]|nr:MAG: hypothetical protein IPM65_00585 [Candidatus Roizmanbacteria bacterium]
MKQYVYTHKLLVILALLFLFIRLPALDQIYLLHDERDIILSGYSIAKTGNDLTGEYLPLAFEGIHPKTPFISIYFSALWWQLMPERSVFFARLPFLISTTLLIFLVYQLILVITRKKDLALLTCVIYCFSPWIFHMTRLALEVNLAILFTLAGCILYLSKRKWVSFLLFFCAFYSYQAYRVLIPLLLIYLELYFILQSDLKLYGKFVKQLAINIGVFIFFFISSIFIDSKITSGRLSEIIFFDTDTLTKEVYFKRMTSTAPSWLQRIFHNKLTSSIDYIIDTALKGISLDHLFKKGDASPTNGTTSGGQFFIFFLPIYLLGLIRLAITKNVSLLYAAGFVVIGIVPSLINSHSATFAFRSSFMALGFAYIIAFGTLFAWKNLIQLPLLLRRSVMIVTLGIVILTVQYFAYNYFFRRSITVSEFYFEHERKLAEYLIANPDIRYVYHTSPSEAYLSYVFLNNDITFNTVRADYSNKKDLEAGSVKFLNCTKHKDLYADKEKARVIFEGCADDKQKKVLIPNPSVGKIPFSDISNQSAYFIVKP